MQVVRPLDDTYYEVERELLEEYGTYRKIPRKDSRLKWLNKTYFNAKAKIRDPINVELHEPEVYRNKLNWRTLDDRIQELGLTKTDVSERVGHTRAWLYTQKTKDLNIKDEDVNKLSNILDLPKSELVVERIPAGRQPVYEIDKDIIQQHIDRIGHTQRTLSTELGLHKLYLNSTLNKGKLPRHIIHTLADIFSVEVEDLMKK